MENTSSLEYNNDIVIIGLGFVGLTLGLKLSEYALVIGIEKDLNKVNLINNGIPHFHEEGIENVLTKAINNQSFLAINELNKYKRSRTKTVFIITIGTPVNKNENSVSSIVLDLLKDLITIIKDEDVIILRSTVSVGTTDFVNQWFKNNNKNIHVAFCPERTIEGKAFLELSSLPQIISGTTDVAINESKTLFSLFAKNIILASSTRIAELAKLSSNIERDVYFSFANELGFVSKKLNLDFSELKTLVSTDYPRSYLKEVGPVAGPCLEKDTYILKQSFQDNLNMDLIETARTLNENWIFKVCDEILKSFSQSNVICLTGLAFKGNPSTDDMRGSLAIPMYNYLIQKGIIVKLFDPTIEKQELIKYFVIDDSNVLNSWDDVVNYCDLIILQNGSPNICKQCKNLNVKFLDITSFNKSILSKDQRLF
jgi:UDP-N-acetyl-D-mannosaminuronic acid dehydrogenase